MKQTRPYLASTLLTLATSAIPAIADTGGRPIEPTIEPQTCQRTCPVEPNQPEQTYNFFRPILEFGRGVPFVTALTIGTVAGLGRIARKRIDN